MSRPPWRNRTIPRAASRSRPRGTRPPRRHRRSQRPLRTRAPHRRRRWYLPRRPRSRPALPSRR
ncbi:MAG: hypothetical protein E6K74_03095 [Candidatus Eisenbacteria bacterium]|uniref:Uncharacterized protein n=1 Tax=Eiseniibacteriota bacterium TaxID=2212470 RepID=A0A538SVU5_UNCEI|nr:MAG: hypothetical protein E6K74_03095 [Candidatus Eisenbacteria bacterium]